MKAVPASKDTKIAAFISVDQTVTSKRKIHRVIYKQSNREIGFDVLNRVVDDDLVALVRWHSSEFIPKDGDIMVALGAMMMYYTYCLGTKKVNRLFRSLHYKGDSTFSVFIDEFDLWWEKGILPEKKQRIQQMLDFERHF